MLTKHFSGVSNPVPRVQHPDWLYKMVREKNDSHQQRKLTEVFKRAPLKSLTNNQPKTTPTTTPTTAAADKRQQTKRQRSTDEVPSHWRDKLGDPPVFKEGAAQFKSWLAFHKKKWKLQKHIRGNSGKVVARGGGEKPARTGTTMDGFVRQGLKSLLSGVWEVIEVVQLDTPGLFRLWVSIGGSIQQVKVTVPRTFYVNCREPKDTDSGVLWRKCSRLLPRSVPVIYLYEYTVPEEIFQEHAGEISTELAGPDIEGVYETGMTPLFRLLVQLGCVCGVDRSHARERSLTGDTSDVFELETLQFKSEAEVNYLSTVQVCSLSLQHNANHIDSLIHPLPAVHTPFPHTCITCEHDFNHSRVNRGKTNHWGNSNHVLPVSHLS
eukprot:sb/3465682/